MFSIKINHNDKKDRIIEILCDADGKMITREIADRLDGFSRTSVWRSLKWLEKADIIEKYKARPENKRECFKWDLKGGLVADNI